MYEFYSTSKCLCVPTSQIISFCSPWNNIILYYITFTKYCTIHPQVFIIPQKIYVYTIHEWEGQTLHRAGPWWWTWGWGQMCGLVRTVRLPGYTCPWGRRGRLEAPHSTWSCQRWSDQPTWDRDARLWSRTAECTSSQNLENEWDKTKWEAKWKDSPISMLSTHTVSLKWWKVFFWQIHLVRNNSLKLSRREPFIISCLQQQLINPYIRM